MFDFKERWKEADIEKNVFLDGFVAFGGGRYQCPGRLVKYYKSCFLKMMITKKNFHLRSILNIK